MRPASTAIGTLRVRWTGRDTHLLHLGLADLLESSDLNPRQAPPDAILLVRRLAGQQPIRLTRPPFTTGLDPKWADMVQQRLDQLYSSAARPNNGHIPDHAGVVLFADESEMLACLVLAVRQGTAGRCWWCRAAAVAWSFTLPIALDRLLCVKPRVLPGTLDLLHAWDRAANVVNAIAPDRLQSLLLLLVRTYGLDDLHALLVQPPGSLQTPHDCARQRDRAEKYPGSRAGMGIPESARLGCASMASPWHKCFPSELRTARLSKAGEAFLGIGLGLHRRPANLRGRLFYRSFSNWWRYPSGTPGVILDRRHGEQINPSAPGIHLPLSAQKASADRLKTTSSELPFVDPRPRKHRADPYSFVPDQDHVSEINSSGKGFRRTQLPACPNPQRSAPKGPSPPKAAEVILDQGVDTDLAGAFYLINLMVSLDLPGSFENSCALAGSVGAWGLLEALNRALLDCLAADLSADPLWSVLAHLGGRKAGCLPGKHFQWDCTYQMPLHWHPQTEAQWYWAADRQCLRLWSDRGYLLADLQRTGEAPTLQAKRLLKNYGKEPMQARLMRKPMSAAPLARPGGGLTRGLNPRLRAWLSRVLPYIRLHLNQSLGLDKGSGADLAKELSLYPGRIHVSASHVDVVMAMDHISLPVRLAGLDRNPRWVPMFGRVILFHYE
jgi:hypothetical protein